MTDLCLNPFPNLYKLLFAKHITFPSMREGIFVYYAEIKKFTKNLLTFGRASWARAPGFLSIVKFYKFLPQFLCNITY